MLFLSIGVMMLPLVWAGQPLWDVACQLPGKALADSVFILAGLKQGVLARDLRGF